MLKEPPDTHFFKGSRRQRRRWFRRIHGVAAFAHLSACVVVFAFFAQGEFPLDVRLTRREPEVLPALLDPVCGGRRHEASEYRDWFQCVREARNGTRGITYGVVDYVDPWEGGIAVLIITFSVITAMFHLFCAFNVHLYLEQLEEGRQPLRWLEYSVTYTIMTVCIFQLNEINGAYEMALLVISGVAQMLIGLAVETIRRHMPKAEAKVQKEKVERQLFTGPPPPPVGCIGQIKDSWAKLRGEKVWGDTATVALLELCGCAILLVHFAIIWDSFRLSFQPYLNSDAGSLFTQLYGFIVVLNLVIYALYLGFPIVHAVVYFNHGSPKTFQYGEVAYVALSLLSKLSLVGIVTFGARRQR